MDQALKDIAAGFISGWTQVLIMQPFQIVKIRLQTQSTTNPYYNGMVDCFQKIVKQQGPASLYKGTVSPLIGIGFQASAMFFTYQYCKRFFNQYKQKIQDRLQLKYIAASAAIASLPTSFVAGPVQHARIRIQIQKTGEKQLYKGSVDAAITVVKNHGIIGIYRGLLATWGRECIGQVAYFLTYESIVRASVRKDQKLSEASLWVSLVGGAFAGISFWIFAYPMDYVKTLLQTDSLNNSQAKYKGTVDCFKIQMKNSGPSIFYRGLGVSLVRAAFVNAGAFFSFEAALRMLGKTQSNQ